MDNSTRDKIQKLIDANPVMVFMKGTKLMPQCGFSNNVVQILNSLGVLWMLITGFKMFSKTISFTKKVTKGESKV